MHKGIIIGVALFILGGLSVGVGIIIYQKHHNAQPQIVQNPVTVNSQSGADAQTTQPAVCQPMVNGVMPEPVVGGKCPTVACTLDETTFEELQAHGKPSLQAYNAYVQLLAKDGCGTPAPYSSL